MASTATRIGVTACERAGPGAVRASPGPRGAAARPSSIDPAAAETVGVLHGALVEGLHGRQCTFSLPTLGRR